MSQMMNLFDGFLSWLAHSSLSASVLIILILVVQWTFRRQLTPRWRHGLWWLLVVRMLLPLAPESRFSIFNLPQWVAGEKGPSEPKERIFPQVLATGTIKDTGLPTPAAASHRAKFPILPVVWMLGVLVLLMRLFWENRRFSAYLLGQRPLTNSLWLNLLEDCKGEMKVQTPVSLIATSGVRSPMLLGFIRPRILLPEALLSSFSQAEMRQVFLHELGHLRRHDIVLNWVSASLQILHWFNPFVWFAFARMRTDRELACDALVLSHQDPAQRQQYGNLIIKLSERFASPGPLPNLAGILEENNQMKTRIMMIAAFTRNSAPKAALGVVLLVGLGLAGLTAATPPKEIIDNSPKSKLQIPLAGSSGPKEGTASVQGATNGVPNQATQDHLFVEAALLKQQGMLAEAEMRLQKLAEWQPEQAAITQMLAEVQQKIKDQQDDPAEVLNRKLQTTIIPEISFHEANPIDVLESLQAASKKYSADGAQISFVWMNDPAAPQTGTVTLSLRNTPLGDIIRYFTQLTGLASRNIASRDTVSHVNIYAVLIYKPKAPASSPVP